MTVSQMLAHCAEVQEVSNGKKLENTPLLVKLFKSMIREIVVNQKDYKKSTKTHPQYLQTSERDFNSEKERLLNALLVFFEMDNSSRAGLYHSLFGKMTEDERAWAMYKHLDHHLRQFGV